MDDKEFRDTVLDELAHGSRMIGLTPLDRSQPERIVSVLSDPGSSMIRVVGGQFGRNKLEFDSLAGEYPQTNYFECELAENHGYLPLGHPWLRPVRKRNVILGNQQYQFYKLEGEEIHEVAVGPIHAGVIEPGHFRFRVPWRTRV